MPDIVCFLVESVNPAEDEWGNDVFDIRRVDSGEIVAHSTYGLFAGDQPGNVKPGAMMYVMHTHDGFHWPRDQFGGNERHLLVATPRGTWCTGCPATSDGTYWTIEGDAPNVTAHPSIRCGANPEYHGWLRNGVLVDA